MCFELGPEGRVMFRTNVARAGTAGPRFRREGVHRRQLHVAFDGGQSDGKALGHLLRRAFPLDDGVDDSFAEIKGIGFHQESLSDQPITMQPALRPNSSRRAAETQR
jgi:hypothetical protein